MTKNYILTFAFLFLLSFLIPASGQLTHHKTLARSSAEAEKVNLKSVTNFLGAMKDHGLELHSLMIVRHGKVVYENWLGDNAADKNHIMNSVSKTFTSMAVGFAVTENRLKVTDKVMSFFPNQLPDTISPYLKQLEIRHLLTMSAGQDLSLVNKVQGMADADWVQSLLAVPFKWKPGEEFEYSSMATYLVSAILQKVTGQKLIDYLQPLLFAPLGIEGATWQESPQGINTGGWGLYIKTEDMAKMGQFLLQKGNWNGKQILPASWINEATTAKISQIPSSADAETRLKAKNSDWMQGYGYQLWRCRHEAFRADGAGGQFIVVLPEKDAVIVTTSQVKDMQAELNLIWDYLLPALQ